MARRSGHNPTCCETLADLKRFAVMPGARFTLVSDNWITGTPRTNRNIGLPRAVIAVRHNGIVTEGCGFIAFGSAGRWSFTLDLAMFREPMPHTQGKGIEMTFRLSLVATEASDVLPDLAT